MLLSTTVAIALAWGASAPALHAGAKHDFDPSVDFSKYQTFRWIGDGPGAAQRSARANGDARRQLSPLVEKQAGESVKRQLEAKGLSYLDQGATADLGVALRTGQTRDVVGYGWGPRYAGPRRVEVDRDGILTIDLVDRKAKELVWRGSIEVESLKEDPEKLHQQIDNLVEKVLTGRERRASPTAAKPEAGSPVLASHCAATGPPGI
jgi:hypothetical protein